MPHQDRTCVLWWNWGNSSQKFSDKNELDRQLSNLVNSSYPSCDPAICKHPWPVTLGLLTGSGTVCKPPNSSQSFSSRLGSHAPLSTNILVQDTEYPSLQIPPTGINTGLRRKTSWSSESPLYAHACQVSVVQHWKNPNSQYNPPSFLACQACNGDISQDTNTQAKQLCTCRHIGWEIVWNSIAKDFLLWRSSNPADRVEKNCHKKQENVGEC